MGLLNAWQESHEKTVLTLASTELAVRSTLVPLSGAKQLSAALLRPIRPRPNMEYGKPLLSAKLF
jgi:hypothetical protein